MTKNKVIEWLESQDTRVMENDQGVGLGIEIFPTLFKKDSLGKIREWHGEIDRDNSENYRAVAGLEDGQKVTSGWTTAVGKNAGKKNETSDEKQARLEINADYAKKLGGEYFPTREEALTTFVRRPMLAQRLDKLNQEKKPLPYAQGLVASQPKLDGMRCAPAPTGLYSRKGKPIESVPHIWEAMQPIFADHPEAELDGELYNHALSGDFEHIMSMCRKGKKDLTAEDIEISRRDVQFHIYDVIMDAPFLERAAWLDENISFNDMLVQVPHTIVESEAHMLEIYEGYVDDLYEGQIIRVSGAGYERNKRSWQLLKHKAFVDMEFIIVDILPGVGNWAGRAKKVVCLLPPDWPHKEARGKTFEAGVKGNYAYTEKLLACKDELLGTDVTVQYMKQLTKYGMPRTGIAKDFHWGVRQD